MNPTALEITVLKNIVGSEYQNSNEAADTVNNPVWSFSVTNETKQLAGALGSCVKKGWAGCDRAPKDDECCWITETGYEILIANK